MKGVPFNILPPGTEEDEDDLEKELGVVDERFASMNTVAESKQSSRVSEFFEKHCISRTYFFQVKKCNDPNCTFHKPIVATVLLILLQAPCPMKSTVFLSMKKKSFFPRL